MKSYIRAIRDGLNCPSSDDSYSNAQFPLTETKHPSATTRSPPLESTCSKIEADVGEATSKTCGVFDDALCVGEEGLGHKSISKRHHSEEDVQRKDGHVHFIPRSNFREAPKVVEKSEDRSSVLEPSISHTTQPQPVKIDEHVELEHTSGSA